MQAQAQEFLDAEELLRLAVRASEGNRPEEALILLKRCINTDPKNARAYYLMGALHAQIGLYDRAKEEITHALSLDPGIENARFQLGLLYVTSGQLREAEHAWAPLDMLAADHPLVLFKDGLLKIARDQFADGVALLTKGISLNTSYPTLNKDMQKVIDSVPGAETAVDTKPAAPQKGKNIFLASYNKDREDE